MKRTRKYEALWNGPACVLAITYTDTRWQTTTRFTTHFKDTQIHVNELSTTINLTIAIISLCMLMLSLHLRCNWFLSMQWYVYEECFIEHDVIFLCRCVHCALCIEHSVNIATVCQYRFIMRWMGRFSVQSATNFIDYIRRFHRHSISSWSV